MTEGKSLLGKAHCLITLAFRAERFKSELLAGVVRVGKDNKIIVVRTSGAHLGQVLPPYMRPGELDRNPAFNSWPMASTEEAKKIISGEIPTYHSGPSIAPGQGLSEYFR